MRRVERSEFDEYLDRKLSDDPVLAGKYAEEFARLPVPTQLAILRRRRRLSQRRLARALKVRQPQVSRQESPGHDPQLSSLERHARALRCRLVVVPDGLLAEAGRLVALEAIRAARRPGSGRSPARST